MISLKISNFKFQITSAGFIKFTRRSLALLLIVSILITGSTLYYLFYLPKGAEAAWFDDSWGYRQRVEDPEQSRRMDVTNSGSAQTDYNKRRDL
jgi:hypothetical protein